MKTKKIKPRLIPRSLYAEMRYFTHFNLKKSYGFRIKDKIKLEGPEGYFYTAKKNPRTHTEKVKRRKYNPKTRKHEEFVEKKIK